MSNTKKPSSPAVVPADVFDADALEFDGTTGPFKAKVGGVVFEFRHPQECVWQDLADALGNPGALLRLVVVDEQRDAFFAKRVEAFRIEGLMNAYQKHYALPSPPESAALPS